MNQEEITQFVPKKLNVLLEENTQCNIFNVKIDNQIIKNIPNLNMPPTDNNKSIKLNNEVSQIIELPKMTTQFSNEPKLIDKQINKIVINGKSNENPINYQLNHNNKTVTHQISKLQLNFETPKKSNNVNQNNVNQNNVNQNMIYKPQNKTNVSLNKINHNTNNLSNKINYNTNNLLNKINHNTQQYEQSKNTLSQPIQHSIHNPFPTSFQPQITSQIQSPPIFDKNANLPPTFYTAWKPPIENKPKKIIPIPQAFTISPSKSLFLQPQNNW